MLSFPNLDVNSPNLVRVSSRVGLSQIIYFYRFCPFYQGSLLSTAIETGNKQAVKMLMDRHIDPSKPEHKSPLFTALVYKDMTLFELMLTNATLDINSPVLVSSIYHIL